MIGAQRQFARIGESCVCSATLAVMLSACLAASLAEAVVAGRARLATQQDQRRPPALDAIQDGGRPDGRLELLSGHEHDVRAGPGRRPPRERLEIHINQRKSICNSSWPRPTSDFSSRSTAKTFVIRRERPVRRMTFEFEQDAASRCVALTEATGPDIVRGDSFWHLYLSEPELVRRHLVPVLEILHPSWQLASMGAASRNRWSNVRGIRSRWREHGCGWSTTWPAPSFPIEPAPSAAASRGTGHPAVPAESGSSPPRCRTGRAGSRACRIAGRGLRGLDRSNRDLAGRRRTGLACSRATRRRCDGRPRSTAVCCAGRSNSIRRRDGSPKGQLDRLKERLDSPPPLEGTADLLGR